ncbi:threonine/serine exporter family protein [Fulvivirga sediminis]|uniref:Threonine/serine exporter family protein n=1 Tax=Fulvivirga sediminis TaxID=2803949 RepID=A0A937K1I1_9BACT|nr:threonine/serine exporter family protein [Fulvivirga sediminis]MBL3657506.1 threonine/serine exporter family protein [Fulvivirga sediminis]
MAENHTETELKELGQTLLRIGAYLMSAGANIQRIRKTVERIAGAFGCTVDLLITNRALMITIGDDKLTHFHSGLKRTLPHGVNFRLVSGISRMSWWVVEKNWSIKDVNNEIDRLVALPHYPRLLVLCVVSLAGASFCRLFGGNYIDMLVAFGATFIGLFVRQESLKRDFNAYLCIFFAAFTSSLIASICIKFRVDVHDQALNACVLYLIPGVPFINSFSDLIHGNIMNGIVKSVHGLIIAFAIAMGLMLAMQICQLLVL